ncbi:hypothetical protein D3C80_1569210 [compost metagenome]
MENRSVVEALLNQGNEVVYGIRGNLRVELSLDNASVIHLNGNDRMAGRGRRDAFGGGSCTFLGSRAGLVAGCIVVRRLVAAACGKDQQQGHHQQQNDWGYSNALHGVNLSFNHE